MWPWLLNASTVKASKQKVSADTADKLSRIICHTRRDKRPARFPYISTLQSQSAGIWLLPAHWQYNVILLQGRVVKMLGFHLHILTMLSFFLPGVLHLLIKRSWLSLHIFWKRKHANPGIISRSLASVIHVINMSNYTSWRTNLMHLFYNVKAFIWIFLLTPSKRLSFTIFQHMCTH